MKIKNVLIIITFVHCFVFAGNAINNLQLKQKFNRLYPISSITDQNISFVRNQSDAFLDDPIRTESGISTLAEYVHLTDFKKAGGAPFVFDNTGNRRNRTIGMGNYYANGFIQTNGTMELSQFGCPEFYSTVFLTIDPETGDEHDPWMGICDEDNVFLGEPPILLRPPVKFPPDGYEQAKDAALNGEGYVFDSTELLNYDFDHRDTLIMTDIQFTADSSVHVKRWWFLKPPHLNLTARLGTSEVPFAFPTQLEGVTDPTTNCASPSDLRTCDSYNDSLISYHAKYPNSVSGMDEYFLDATISGPHGYSTSEYIPHSMETGLPDPNNLLSEEILTPNGPVVLYIQGGPVRVHGIYQGQYTILTDEYITYRRHAWPNNYYAPIDTLWCNIWITDDLRNAEAPVVMMAQRNPMKIVMVVLKTAWD